jgi:signal transduction histidine kinase
MKVLLVDDAASNRQVLKACLEAAGMETCEASDGVEAMTILEQEKANVIISDILMPNMDGYTLCKEVRRNVTHCDLPFIFYTASYTSAADEKRAFACGADRYLRKPAPMSELLDALHALNYHAAKREASQVAADETALEMKVYSELLVRTLEERNEELETAKAEILLANKELEQRVEERTGELTFANEELEAFSQSIAHDLRGHLNVILGFGELLIDECQDKVSTNAMEHLELIGMAARRMNELTNNLLRLAQASRAEIVSQVVNLSTLVGTVIDELAPQFGLKNVQISIAPNAIANGDVGLLRIALENLLANAFKYVKKTISPRIEFGTEASTVENVYFVRDNGVGFDMLKAGKLFGAFVRLHSSEEYAGTGIGLNTAKRIIGRHGGRIWAEAAPNKGATFYFTLRNSGPAAVKHGEGPKI